jgi:hypothetical protein
MVTPASVHTPNALRCEHAAQRPRAKLPGGSGQLSPTLRHACRQDKRPRRVSFSELLGDGMRRQALAWALGWTQGQSAQLNPIVIDQGLAPTQVIVPSRSTSNSTSELTQGSHPQD